MDFKSSLSNAAALLALLATSWSILATSRAGGLQPGQYVIKSDCTPTVSEAIVQISMGRISEPAGQSFTDYGLPSTTLNLTETSTGVIEGVNRSCVKTAGDDQGSEWVFSCYDDDEFVCSVYLTRQ
jgi:hypothetical protein